MDAPRPIIKNRAVINPSTRQPIIQQPRNRTGLNADNMPSSKGVSARLYTLARQKPR